jgi:hypothetical protein
MPELGRTELLSPRDTAFARVGSCKLSFDLFLWIDNPCTGTFDDASKNRKPKFDSREVF